MTRGRTTQRGGITVEIPCRECGRPIVMVAGGEGTEIADRAAFLRDHRDCLLAAVPGQRSPGQGAPGQGAPGRGA